MSLTTGLATGITISGALIGLAGFALSYGTTRRSQYDRVLAETAKLTTGPIAISRHEIAKKLEDLPSSIAVEFTDDEVAHFYDVLWTFERIDALFISLKPIVPRGRFTRPQRLLLISVRGAAQTWTTWTELQHPIKDITISRRGLDHLHLHAQRVNDPLTAKLIDKTKRWLKSRSIEEVRPAVPAEVDGAA
jgi:hypothetical protein